MWGLTLKELIYCMLSFTIFRSVIILFFLINLVSTACAGTKLI